ncbi:hypothetical protein NL676_008062 [Syzygium grande]|nr:hypothetical protein NL676_008062 [Syzygium grande]
MRIVQGLSYLRDLKVLELVNDPDEEEISSSEMFQTESFAWISSLSNLETLKLCLPNVSSLPEDFNALTQLRKLDLSCMNLLDLPQLPSSLSKLLIMNCQIQGMKLSNLETLSELELCDCNAWEILGLGNLRLLLPDLSKCTSLEIKEIDFCNIQDQPCERYSKNCCSRHCDCPHQYQCGGRCML